MDLYFLLKRINEIKFFVQQNVIRSAFRATLSSGLTNHREGEFSETRGRFFLKILTSNGRRQIDTFSLLWEYIFRKTHVAVNMQGGYTFRSKRVLMHDI